MGEEGIRNTEDQRRIWTTGAKAAEVDPHGFQVHNLSISHIITCRLSIKSRRSLRFQVERVNTKFRGPIPPEEQLAVDLRCGKRRCIILIT